MILVHDLRRIIFKFYAPDLSNKQTKPPRNAVSAHLWSLGQRIKNHLRFLEQILISFLCQVNTFFDVINYNPKKF